MLSIYPYTHSCITLITQLYEYVVFLIFSKLQTIYSPLINQNDIYVYGQKNINDNKDIRLEILICLKITTV